MNPEPDIVLSVSRGDSWLAEDLLAWSARLGSIDRPLRVVASSKVSDCALGRIRHLAQAAFASVAVDVIDDPNEPDGWPQGPNFQFAYTADRSERPFLWLEPDCVPLKARWAETILDEWAACPKPVLADKYDSEHFSGIGIYTPVAAKAIIRQGAANRAWDSREPKFFAELAHPSVGIQHFWGTMGVPPRFVRWVPRENGEVTGNLIRTGSVLFHRCKDTSLRRLIEHPNPGKPACFVQLGRAGDILAVLPCAREWFLDRGRKPHFMVSKRYADILEGVSYVEPVVFDGDWYHEFPRAFKQAKQMFGDDVIVPQNSMHRVQPAMRHSRYTLDQWRQAGMLDRFPTARLVFDRRNKAREEASFKTPNKPFILVNTLGFSAPFAAKDRLLAELYRWRAYFAIVESGIMPRLFDLLGVIDKASLLVTIDTSTLHLASASKTPYVAFFRDRPKAWYGGIPRGNCVLAMPYSEADGRLDKVSVAIRRRVAGRVAFHVYAQGPSTGHTLRRESVARSTWGALTWVDTPVRDADVPRLFDDGKRKLPFLRDVIDRATAAAFPDDIIVLTNADTCCLPSVLDIKTPLPAWGSRRDFRLIQAPMNASQVMSGKPYPGKDIFVFTADWWRENRLRIPDLLIGAEWWDHCMSRFIGQSEIKNQVYHEIHDSVWYQRENRASLPSQIHNTLLTREFLKTL